LADGRRNLGGLIIIIIMEIAHKVKIKAPKTKTYSIMLACNHITFGYTDRKTKPPATKACIKLPS